MFFTVNNNLNVNHEEKSEIRGDLRYLFLIRESTNNDNIIFSIFLKNSHHSIINKIWFSAFVGIAKTKFGPGMSEQNSFHIKSGGSYLSGYTKEEIKLPPETIIEILYFDIPKSSLLNEGSLEFFFGCESVKKVSFMASWQKDEIKNKIKQLNTQSFINFLKYKNQKTCFERILLFTKRAYKNLKNLLKRIKGCVKKENNFK